MAGKHTAEVKPGEVLFEVRGPGWSSMPGWLQAFASNQPVTYMADAVRSLSQGHAAELLIGHSTGYLVSGSLLWALGFVVVFAPLAALKYKHS